MTLTANEHIYNGEARDADGRLIVVTKDGATIGAGGGGSDPLSDGTDAGALPTKTLWVAGADGTVLRGLRVDSTGRARTVVENTVTVNHPGLLRTDKTAFTEGTTQMSVMGAVVNDTISSDPAEDNAAALRITSKRGVHVNLRDTSGTELGTSGNPVRSDPTGTTTQPISGTVTGNQGSANTAANGWPVKVTDGTNTAQVLAAAPGSDSGQSALAVRVISQLGAGSGGGGGGQADKSAFTEGTTSFQPVGGVLNETITADPTEDQAAAARITPKRAVHTNLRNNSGTEIATATNPVRTDPTGTTTQPVSGTVGVNNFPATQPVSGTVTANAGTGPWPVTDNSGSLTVDAPVATPVNVRLSDGTANYDGTKTGQLPSALVGGRLDVNIGASSLSSLAINNVETIADNAGYVDGTSKVFPAGYIFDETAGTALTENDVAAARLDSKRALINVLEDATTRGRRATVSATGGLLGDQGAPATQTNAWFIRNRKLVTYGAVLRGGTLASPSHFSNAFAAAGRKQFVTLFHAASATKTVKLRKVRVAVVSNTVATVIFVDLIRLTSATTPATGNPTITPSPMLSSDPAAEVTILGLPTTAGTESGSPIASIEYSLGVTAAASTVNPPPPIAYYDLYVDNNADGEGTLPTIRAGVAEGFALTMYSSAASTILFIAQIEFTEE